jgi:hypothetical protein
MNMKDDAVPVGERWDLQPLRIAAMQVASPESDSLPILDKWHELRFNSEQLLHVMGDDYFALYDAERHEQRLTEYISRAHAHGMKIIAYGNLMQVPQVSSEPPMTGCRSAWTVQATRAPVSIRHTGTGPSRLQPASWIAARTACFWMARTFATMDAIADTAKPGSKRPTASRSQDHGMMRKCGRSSRISDETR